ncbi:HAMP domain-containing methyl-accepting chemotaxis protein [Magnetospirillum sp. 15-1]|uniref:methyl-accepting chemotaxis protein n=1 Tax=Magnetospirillum sp. 15-1 TaxID=1979370 RepID=UPI000BBC43E7|nr:HAMP domain-containing methyl-accepting chemotaxis protein [Magnetospirillum sp. 15-1]
MSQLSIRVRIASLAAAGIIMIGMVTGLMFWSMKRLDEVDAKTRAYDAVVLASKDMWGGSLEVRRHEKDFLIRRDVRYADQALTAAEQVVARAGRLEKIPEAAPVVDHIGAIRSGTATYVGKMHNVQASMVTAGLDEKSGMQGELREAVHAVERVISDSGEQDLMVHMLMLRRHEKDYLLRGQVDYLAKLEAEHKAFLGSLGRSALAPARKAELQGLIDTYLAKARLMIEADQTLRRDIAALSAAYAAFTPAFDKIVEFADAQENLVRAENDHVRHNVTMVATALSGTATLLFIVLATVIGRSIVRPVKGITGVMTALSGGDRQITVPYADNRDEIGEMARSVQVFKDGLIRAEQLEAEARAEQEREVQRGRKRELLTADFDVMIRRVIAKVDSTVQNVHSTSSSLHAAAEQTSRQSAAVAAAAEEASSNIQTVASAAEELGVSTQEISRRVQDTTRITQEAVDGVQTADATVEGLSTAAQKIGEIVGLITDIAAQTNLLALNATIEAARAGEAGKGFAVVANEVKHLATQTAKATSEIAEQIGGIQSTTQSAVAAIKTVGAAIGRVDEVVSSIAAAVEEQNAATQEIVRNVQEAANGNHEVTSNITEVSSAARMTGEMASSMSTVAEDMKEAGTSLGKHVETFLGSVKTV